MNIIGQMYSRWADGQYGNTYMPVFRTDRLEENDLRVTLLDGTVGCISHTIGEDTHIYYDSTDTVGGRCQIKQYPASILHAANMTTHNGFLLSQAGHTAYYSYSGLWSLSIDRYGNLNKVGHGNHELTEGVAAWDGSVYAIWDHADSTYSGVTKWDLKEDGSLEYVNTYQEYDSHYHYGICDHFLSNRSAIYRIENNEDGEVYIGEKVVNKYNFGLTQGYYITKSVDHDTRLEKVNSSSSWTYSGPYENVEYGSLGVLGTVQYVHMQNYEQTGGGLWDPVYDYQRSICKVSDWTKVAEVILDSGSGDYPYYREIVLQPSFGYLFVGYYDGTVEVRDTTDLSLVRTYVFDVPIRCMASDLNYLYVATGRVGGYADPGDPGNIWSIDVKADGRLEKRYPYPTND